MPDNDFECCHNHVNHALTLADGVLAAHDRRVAYWELDRITQRNLELRAVISLVVYRSTQHNIPAHDELTSALDRYTEARLNRAA